MTTSTTQAEHLKSALLEGAGFSHAFFTRYGGVSEGAYKSLNFSYAVGDSHSHVDANFQLAARSLGVRTERLFLLSQVHGNRVVELGGEEERRHVLFTEGDALVTGAAMTACGVRTADCIPVLLADPTTGRVASAHAGWRGIESRVLENTVKRLSTAPSRCIAAIGPHISEAAFEVSADVGRRLKAAGLGIHCVRETANQKAHVSLGDIAEFQLRRAGVVMLEQVRGCTFSEPDRFFSYRRQGKRSGRHLSAIVARESDSGAPRRTSS